jgi:hypothetical protein
MLTIHAPEQAQFEASGGVSECLWFETAPEYGQYLSPERSDAFVVALLLYAMSRHEQEVRVCAPMSERLYYCLTKYLVDVVAAMNPALAPIRISGPCLGSSIGTGQAAGTGLSCGVDSLATVIDHMGDDCPPAYRLTHFTFYNVGASGDYGGEAARRLFKQRAKKSRLFAEERGVPLVELDSNLSEVLGASFLPTHTYRNVAATLALQKLFSRYYYASGLPLSRFKLDWHDPAHYDAFALNMLSTESLELYSSGLSLTRVEKTRKVSAFEPSYRHLNVCVADHHNCSKCHKCLRTMLTLEVLGRLHLYDKVFDLTQYQRRRVRYLATVLALGASDPFMGEIADAIRQTRFPIPARAMIRSWFMKYRYYHAFDVLRRTFRELCPGQKVSSGTQPDSSECGSAVCKPDPFQHPVSA